MIVCRMVCLYKFFSVSRSVYGILSIDVVDQAVLKQLLKYISANNHGFMNGYASGIVTKNCNTEPKAYRKMLNCSLRLA
jgi:hypothetical protein